MMSVYALRPGCSGSWGFKISGLNDARLVTLGFRVT